jgi:hypothetical protein
MTSPRARVAERDHLGRVRGRPATAAEVAALQRAITAPPAESKEDTPCPVPNSNSTRER